MLSGKEFQSLRREQGFKSARELAEVSGVTREILAQFESGARDTLSVEQVVGLCSALHVSVYELIPELVDIDPTFEFLRKAVKSDLLRALASL